MLFSSHPAFKSVPRAQFKSASRGERVNAMIRVVRVITIKKFVVLRKNLIRCTVERKKRKRSVVKANSGGGANNEQMGCES